MYMRSTSPRLGLRRASAEPLGHDQALPRAHAEDRARPQMPRLRDAAARGGPRGDRPPVANLFVSSDRSDADVFAYLCDVDEHGESVYVTEGQLRAGWHRLFPDDDQVARALDIKPDLPWHGHRRGGYDKNPLRGGKIAMMRFDLFPIAWVFKKGHRVRLALAGVDAGNFELNPAMRATAGKQPTIYIHRGGRESSVSSCRLSLEQLPLACMPTYSKGRVREKVPG